jgi:hypothetical protein
VLAAAKTVPPHAVITRQHRLEFFTAWPFTVPPMAAAVISSREGPAKAQHCVLESHGCQYIHGLAVNGTLADYTGLAASEYGTTSRQALERARS